MKPAAAHPAGLSEPSAPRSSETPAAFLDAVLRSRAGLPQTVVISVPAPVVSPVTVWRVAEAEPTAFLWEPPEGAALVGWGACHVLEPSGDQRGAQARQRAQEVAGDLEAVHHPDVPAVPPRWWGGLSFAPGTASQPPWAEFGDGRFVLPRWCYGRDARRAWLSFATDARQLTDATREEAGSALRQLFDTLTHLAERGRTDVDRERKIERKPEGVGRAEAASSPPRTAHLARGPWDDQVRAVQNAITGGAVEKVVIARCSTVQAASALDPAQVLSRLGAHYPGCTRFAMRCGDATFLGATPERLVARHGPKVVSEAMAGSVPHGASASLLASEKDRREHALVVAAIVDGLSPFCTALDRRPEPEVRELPNVVHLRTPVTGRLSRPVHVLELLDALHPTPAVGGVPVAEAVSWILAHEAMPRGWYSGPVGWFDAAGDGEFAVALRSGLLRGDRAWAYAGAGIVRGSTPDAEYAETALKLRPMLDAIGTGVDGAGV